MVISNEFKTLDGIFLLSYIYLNQQRRSFIFWTERKDGKLISGLWRAGGTVTYTFCTVMGPKPAIFTDWGTRVQSSA